MKIERYTVPGHFWNWIRANLPASLVGKEILQGYAIGQYIYRRGYRRGVLDTVFEREGEAIAFVGLNSLELLYPEYFSDFEDLCRRYEAETGEEITFKYWESPKKSA